MSRQPSPIEYVPEDIVVEILSRLPVKSLCRFKSVSKAWRNLISDSWFAKLQRNQSIKSKRLTYVMCCWSDFPQSLKLDYDFLVREHKANLVAEDSSFGLEFSGNDLRMKMWGSCNGLLCVFSSSGTLALVNPSTRQTRTILSDQDRSDQDPKIMPFFAAMHPIYVGFGYDSFNDDYKVVYIDRWTDHTATVVYVYSLKNHAWSRIGDFPAACIQGYCVHMNGFIYWITTYDSELSLSITAFDLSKNEFSRIPTPLSNNLCLSSQLLTVGGSLCIGVGGYASKVYEFWVMKNYGVLESWRRMDLTLDCHTVPSMLDFPNSEETLILTKGSLFLYNHRNGSLKSVTLGRIPTGYYKAWLNYVFSYMECIVAL